MKYFISYRVLETSSYGRCSIERELPISGIRQIAEIEKDIAREHEESVHQGTVIILGWQKFEEEPVA